MGVRSTLFRLELRLRLRLRLRLAHLALRLGLGLGLGSAFVTTEARAGGFEIPDNGTEALGRGGAFVAKADDGTAIYYNPAGLARQRGTNLLLNGSLYFHSFEFRRGGAYPDDANDAATPWGGLPYPAVSNTGGPYFQPFIAATTDFHYFDRLTVGVGVFGPPSIGNRTFPLGVDGKPASSRYDFVQSRSSMLMPTLSAGLRVTPWLDLGASAHLVLANFDQTSVSYDDVGNDVCKNEEYQPCDARTTLTAKATTFAATFGAMIRPSAPLSFGVSVRPPINITANGVVTPTSPTAGDVKLEPGNATLALQLPWMIRAGGRYVAMDGTFEVYDLELDVTYETWKSAQGLGPIVRVPDLGQFKNIETVILHGYRNTFSVRGGGAYNIEAAGGILSLRGGAYFDSAATAFATTRLDHDTLSKIAGTLGLGFKYGALRFDLSYAAVASIPRIVGGGDGEIRPINDAKEGQSVDANDDALPSVNEGAYRGFTHILALGVGVTFDGLFGSPRPVRFGNSYEAGYLPEGENPPEKKPEEPKPEPEKSAPAEKAPSPVPIEKAPEKKPAAEKPPEKKPEVERPPEKKPEKKPKKKEWWEDLD